jgi:hypothetical protein
MKSPLVLALVGMLAGVVGQGCSGQCGLVVPEFAAGGGDGGMVTFAPLVVGQDESLSIPVQDSVSSGDTIIGASLTGNDLAAFRVLSSFPMVVPGPGESGSPIVVQFTPTAVGTATADVLLSTENMGTTVVHLTGSGLAAQ